MGDVSIANEFETILWGENMEAEYETAEEWYKANRRELKKYRVSGSLILIEVLLVAIWIIER